MVNDQEKNQFNSRIELLESENQKKNYEISTLKDKLDNTLISNQN